jgi:hypothetical protein
MVTDTAAKTDKANTTTLSDRAGDLKDRAGALLQEGVDTVKAHPGATAAVVGGAVAAAAAYVGRDKIAEAATAVRDKVQGSAKAGNGKA